MGKRILHIGVAVVAYIMVFVIGATSSLLHPACYAYFGTIAPILFAFPYLVVASEIRTFGAATILNGHTRVCALVMDEGNAAFIIILIVLTILSEIIRGVRGYGSLRGVRLSFIPLALSYYGYAAHWWTATAATLQDATEEMSADYAVLVEQVIRNVPMLCVMVLLAIPVAILGMRLAERVMGRRAATFE